MDCEKFQAYLRGCVEHHRIPDVEPFAVHLESCPVCQQEWTHWQVLERAVSEWNDLGETPDLSSRVLSEVNHGSPQRSATSSDRTTRRTSSRWIMATTAALLLAVILPLVINFLNRQQDSSHSMVNKDPATEDLRPVRTPVNPKEVSWDDLVGTTRTAYSSLLNEAGIQPQAFSNTEIEQDPNPEPRNDDPAGPTSLGLLSRDVRESVGFLGRLLPPRQTSP